MVVFLVILLLNFFLYAKVVFLGQVVQSPIKLIRDYRELWFKFNTSKLRFWSLGFDIDCSLPLA